MKKIKTRGLAQHTHPPTHSHPHSLAHSLTLSLTLSFASCGDRLRLIWQAVMRPCLRHSSTPHTSTAALPTPARLRTPFSPWRGRSARPPLALQPVPSSSAPSSHAASPIRWSRWPQREPPALSWASKESMQVCYWSARQGHRWVKPTTTTTTTAAAAAAGAAGAAMTATVTQVVEKQEESLWRRCCTTPEPHRRQRLWQDGLSTHWCPTQHQPQQRHSSPQHRPLPPPQHHPHPRLVSPQTQQHPCLINSSTTNSTTMTTTTTATTHCAAVCLHLQQSQRPARHVPQSLRQMLNASFALACCMSP